MSQWIRGLFCDKARVNNASSAVSSVVLNCLPAGTTDVDEISSFLKDKFPIKLLIEYVLSTNNNYYDQTRSKSLLKDYLVEDFGKDFVERKKMGFVFDLENWVYSNTKTIEDYFYNGKILKNLNENILKTLSLRKSRINANRIWKIFILEYYLSKLVR